jgi:inner membrane protein
VGSGRIRAVLGRRRAERPRGTTRAWIRPLLVAGAVLTLHLAYDARRWPLIPEALLDEPAHLLTAWLVLAALPGDLLRRRVGRWALLSSVAIDVDHIPLYLFGRGFSVGGRPPTHSLALVCVALGAAALCRPVRERALGVALGVSLHLFRDLATGPGVPLLWPVAGSSVRVPQAVYLTIVVSAAVVAAARVRARERAG